MRIWLLAGLGIAALAALVVLGVSSREEPPAGPGSGPSEYAGAPPAGAQEGDPWREAAPLAAEPRGAPVAAPMAEATASRSEVAHAESAAGPSGAASERGPFPTLLPREKTLDGVALEELARDRARELGFELPPEVRDALRAQEPLPGEDEPAFAERLQDLESEALSDELLVEYVLRQRYGREPYRWGDPTSHHRAEAVQQVEAMTPEQRASWLTGALNRVDGPAQPRFYPPDQVAPYQGPGAEPPPEGFRWVEPELLAPPSLE